MILVWGVDDDSPTAAILAALARAGAAHRFIDQRASLPDASFSFGATFGGRIATQNLAAVTAVFMRPNDVPVVPSMSTAALIRFNHCFTVWSELTPALVVNRLSAQASNTSKLYQAAIIRSEFFAVPASLATTDPTAARAFLGRHGAVIYKSLSGVRSIVRRLGADELDRLDDVHSCPTMFQSYVEGTDYRVHVVGNEVFATMVVSAEDDYRYDHLTDRAAVRLPAPVADRCIRLARTLGLVITGIDLRRTPEGEWVCFEANPSPAFTYFEEGTEIADATASLLMGAGAAAG